jgi:competence protein ComEA
MGGVQKWFEKFHHAMGFTKQETRVVMFLLMALVAGSAVRIFRHTENRLQEFDYASSDSVFLARSQSMALTDSSALAAGANRRPQRLVQRQGRGRTSLPASKSVNINTATKDGLMKLPGVGETTALEIVRYRVEHGPFASVEGLLAVKGIGKKKLERIEAFITVER